MDQGRRSIPANHCLGHIRGQNQPCEIGAWPGGRDISNTLTLRLRKISGSVIRQSIRRRIVSIAVGLIILMVLTSLLSMAMVGRVGRLLDELTARYIPANTHLTRITVLSLERALAIRRMVIARMQEPPDEMGYKLRKQMYEAKGAEIDAEAQAARALINAVIDDDSTPSDNAALARIENRIENLVRRLPAQPQGSHGAVALGAGGAGFCGGETQPRARRRASRRARGKNRGRSARHAEDELWRHRKHPRGAEPGGDHLGDRHRARRDCRIDLCKPGQRRHHSLGPAAPRGDACSRGG